MDRDIKDCRIDELPTVLNHIPVVPEVTQSGGCPCDRFFEKHTKRYTFEDVDIFVEGIVGETFIDVMNSEILVCLPATRGVRSYELAAYVDVSGNK